MIYKLFIACLMILIVFNLARAMMFLLHDKGQTTRTVRALSWRIGLSLSLFSLLILGMSFGWLIPHGV